MVYMCVFLLCQEFFDMILVNNPSFDDGGVTKTVGIMCRVRRAFEVFDNPDQDLTQFIELRIFLRCDQFSVSWPRGIEPMLA
jgi:hypothetical protein